MLLLRRISYMVSYLFISRGRHIVNAPLSVRHTSCPLNNSGMLWRIFWITWQICSTGKDDVLRTWLGPPGQSNSLQTSLIPVNSSNMHWRISKWLSRYVYKSTTMCRLQDPGSAGQGRTLKMFIICSCSVTVTECQINNSNYLAKLFIRWRRCVAYMTKGQQFSVKVTIDWCLNSWRSISLTRRCLTRGCFLGLISL